MTPKAVYAAQYHGWKRPCPREAKGSEVEDLLRQALQLGCSFDCGTAYITRAYIDEQDDIVRRAVELGVIPERSVVPNRRDYRRD